MINIAYAEYPSGRTLAQSFTETPLLPVVGHIVRFENRFYEVKSVCLNLEPVVGVESVSVIVERMPS